MTRHEERFDVEAATDGDYISPKLVARDTAQLGSELSRDADGVVAELLTVTATSPFDDMETAILFHEESGTIVIGSTTAYRDSWKVLDIGENVVVEDASGVHRPEGERDTGEVEYMQTWVDIIFDEFSAGHFDIGDEREMVSRSSLKLKDPWANREGMVEIHLE